MVSAKCVPLLRKSSVSRNNYSEISFRFHWLKLSITKGKHKGMGNQL